MEQLKWHIEKRKVSELKSWDKNPRIITEENFKRLKQRITERGFHDVIKIDLDNTILSGNQRKVALLQLGMAEVDCIIPNRTLTENERDAIAIESNKHEGNFDFELLANRFEVDLLKNCGFSDLELNGGSIKMEPEATAKLSKVAKIIKCPNCNFTFENENKKMPSMQ